jgi:hypothetical protein
LSFAVFTGALCLGGVVAQPQTPATKMIPLTKQVIYRISRPRDGKDHECKIRADEFRANFNVRREFERLAQKWNELADQEDHDTKTIRASVVPGSEAQQVGDGLVY